MNSLLITGVDGVVGANLALALADRFQVQGCCAGEAPELEGVAVQYGNPADAAHMASLVADLSPRWIIHCGGFSRASWELSQAPAAHEAGAVAALADAANQAGSSLTVISTDAVFAGPRLFHEEESSPKAMTPLAQSALAMEQAAVSRGALVVRTHAYGWSPLESSAGFAQQAWQSLAGAVPFAADGQRYATPILATDLAEVLLRSYELRLEGVYHIAGAERTSPFRFAAELALAFGLQSPRSRSGAVPMRSPGSHEETSLNSRRIRRVLELPMPMLREGLQRFAAQEANGWRERFGSIRQSMLCEQAA